MGVYDVAGVVVQPAAHGENALDGFFLEGHGLDRDAAFSRCQENFCTGRGKQGDPVSTRHHALRFGQDADLLATPTLRGFGVDDMKRFAIFHAINLAYQQGRLLARRLW